MFLKPTIIALFAINFPFAYLSAQVNMPRYEIGAGPAIFIYQGDLSPALAGSYRTLRPGLAVMGTRILNSSFALRAGLAFGSLTASDSKYDSPEWRKQRNFSFRTPVTEISAVAIFNIAGTNGNNDAKVLSPYVFGGISYSFLNISRDYSQYNTDYFGSESWVTQGLANDIDHSLPRGIIALPVGIGVRYPINSSFSVAAESSYRIAFTDYLDGFSQSAGPTHKDYFHTHLLSLIYTFKSYQGIKCPVVKL